MPLRPVPPASRLPALLALFALLWLPGCGGGSDASPADTAGSVAEATADSAGGEELPDDRWDISAADVDRTVRGLQGEVDSLRIASRRVQAIADQRVRVQEYAQLIPVVFMAPGARAAGLPEDRYSELRSNLHDGYNALTGGADSSTSQEILRHLKPDARQALERQVPKIRALYEEQNQLTAKAGGYDTLLTK
jgi:hypothetical protein